MKQRAFYVFIFTNDGGERYSYTSNTKGVLMIGDRDAASMGFNPPTATPDGAPVRRLPRGGVMFSVHHMGVKRVLTADDGRVWRLVTKTISPR